MSDSLNLSKSNAARASQNSQCTVGNQKGDEPVVSMYRFIGHEGRHALLKGALAVYCLKGSYDYSCFERAQKERMRIKEAQANYNEASKLFGNAKSLGDEFGNIFGDAFERNMRKLELERAEKKMNKYHKSIEHRKKLGRFIGNVLRTADMASRTLAMKSAIGSPYGATHGATRENLIFAPGTMSEQLNNHMDYNI